MILKVKLIVNFQRLLILFYFMTLTLFEDNTVRLLCLNLIFLPQYAYIILYLIFFISLWRIFFGCFVDSFQFCRLVQLIDSNALDKFIYLQFTIERHLNDDGWVVFDHHVSQSAFYLFCQLWMGCLNILVNWLLRKATPTESM